MKIKWYREPFPGNFGDILTPKILDYFGIKYEYSIKNYDTICVGSIARWANTGVNVLGSGIMYSSDKLCSESNWFFVRGPLTRQRVIECSGTCPEIYGDPALLLPLLCNESHKRYDVGIIPHYVDYEHVKEKYPQYHIIDILNEDPFEVAKKITECRSIISSSLHGIICANAYGIPAAWVRFSDKLCGDDVKFSDYFQSVGCKTIRSTMDDLHFTVGSIDLSPIITIFEGL